MIDTAVMSIELTHGQVALIDSSDYYLISMYQWRARKNKNGSTWYAVATTQSLTPGAAPVYMYRLILGAKPGDEVDHFNRNGTDNRKVNLRLCTRSQNAANQPLKHGSSSQYKCVRWDQRREGWKAYINMDGKQRTLGYFANEKDAAFAYDKAARQKYGGFAGLNFPDEILDSPV